MSTSSLPRSSTSSKPKPTLARESAISLNKTPSRNPSPSTAQDHWVGGNPPTGFRNPWPSFSNISFFSAFRTRFGSHPEKNFVPVPSPTAEGVRSSELVRVRKPDWGLSSPDKLRATWLGHASWMVETPAAPGCERSIRILLDPVFSERTSPFSFLGPKRYTPTPCSVSDLPPVDIVLISHNHYDHLDLATVQELHALRGKGNVKFLVARNGSAWFRENVCDADDVMELDWWEGAEIGVDGLEDKIRVTCTPCQHASARTGRDAGKALWCSWVVETVPSQGNGKKVYFAGDTGYQASDAPSPCPAFEQIGSVFGSLDLALVPIGLFKPQTFMGGVHCSPEQALRIHHDVRAKLSIGMHYGTVRGGISAHYEDVREPPRRWKEAAEKEGCWLGGGIAGDGKPVETESGRHGVGLCDVGETVAV